MPINDFYCLVMSIKVIRAGYVSKMYSEMGKLLIRSRKLFASSKFHSKSSNTIAHIYEMDLRIV